jgi:hypothetical protein
MSMKECKQHEENLLRICDDANVKVIEVGSTKKGHGVIVYEIRGERHKFFYAMTGRVAGKGRTNSLCELKRILRAQGARV